MFSHVALAVAVLVAAVSHGAIITTPVGVVLVTWWELPLHLGCVWLAGNVARGKGRDPNIVHALGAWFGVLGPVMALRLADSDRFETHEPFRLSGIIAAVVVGSAIVAALASLGGLPVAGA